MIKTCTCGGQPHKIKDTEKLFRIRCPKCAAHTVHGDEEFVLEFWNDLVDYMDEDEQRKQRYSIQEQASKV